MPRTGIQLCVPFEEKRLERWTPPYIVQPKLDGERCRSIPILRSTLLVSSEENIFYSVPHINQAIKDCGLENVELDGELYIHNSTFEEIHSRVSRTVNLHPEYEEVTFSIFDIVIQGVNMLDRLAILKGLNDKMKGPLKMVPFVFANSLEDVMRAYDDFLSQGYEGIVVRHTDATYVRKRSTFLMKFKPKKEDIYEIIGWKEEVDKNGKPKGRLGALLCTSDEGTEFWVGSGLTDEQRESYWKEPEALLMCNVKVQYQHMTSGKKVPRFPVFVEIIN